jgi:hypothetical protein
MPVEDGLLRDLEGLMRAKTDAEIEVGPWRGRMTAMAWNLRHCRPYLGYLNVVVQPLDQSARRKVGTCKECIMFPLRSYPV